VDLRDFVVGDEGSGRDRSGGGGSRAGNRRPLDGIAGPSAAGWFHD
jgi:hypothetical protein